uniref:Uncharacterized protein n=1 Tax=Oryza barthii TaxID=65489 RepID=A0A0D3EUB4_9ORYZ
MRPRAFAPPCLPGSGPLPGLAVPGRGDLFPAAGSVVGRRVRSRSRRPGRRRSRSGRVRPPLRPLPPRRTSRPRRSRGRSSSAL